MEDLQTLNQMYHYLYEIINLNNLLYIDVRIQFLMQYQGVLLQFGIVVIH